MVFYKTPTTAIFISSIPVSTFIKWTDAIVAIFPTETQGTYFCPYKAVNRVKCGPSGSLYVHFNHEKDKLRKAEVLQYKEPLPTQECTVTDGQDCHQSTSGIYINIIRHTYFYEMNQCICLSKKSKITFWCRLR